MEFYTKLFKMYIEVQEIETYQTFVLQLDNAILT